MKPFFCWQAGDAQIPITSKTNSIRDLKKKHQQQHETWITFHSEANISCVCRGNGLAQSEIQSLDFMGALQVIVWELNWPACTLDLSHTDGGNAVFERKPWTFLLCCNSDDLPGELSSNISLKQLKAFFLWVPAWWPSDVLYGRLIPIPCF